MAKSSEGKGKFGEKIGDSLSHSVLSSATLPYCDLRRMREEIFLGETHISLKEAYYMHLQEEVSIYRGCIYNGSLFTMEKSSVYIVERAGREVSQRKIRCWKKGDIMGVNE